VATATTTATNNETIVIGDEVVQSKVQGPRKRDSLRYHLVGKAVLAPLLGRELAAEVKTKLAETAGRIELVV
jgi:hypothetical protein